MSQIPKPHEIYRHFKGQLYQINAIAEHSETGEKLVIYQAMYGDFKIYARPLSMFMEKVDRKKYPDALQEYRFELQNGQAAVETTACACTQSQETGTGSPKEAPSGVSAGGQAGSGVKEVQESAALQESCDGQVTAEEQLQIDPMVLQFLEADSYEERINILVGLHHRITHDMINTMAIASDVEVPEGELEERYEGLKNCLTTLQKYECSRLR